MRSRTRPPDPDDRQVTFVQFLKDRRVITGHRFQTSIQLARAHPEGEVPRQSRSGHYRLSQQTDRPSLPFTRPAVQRPRRVHATTAREPLARRDNTAITNRRSTASAGSARRAPRSSMPGRTATTTARYCLSSPRSRTLRRNLSATRGDALSRSRHDRPYLSGSRRSSTGSSAILIGS